jgi:uncharacterized membrane protein YGL010W
MVMQAIVGKVSQLAIAPLALQRYHAASIRKETDAMSSATELMTKYAAYHRDRRNIATHFVGIPLIVFAIGVLLARPTIGSVDTSWGLVNLTPALLLWAVSTLWYLTRGEFFLGLAVSCANGALILLAAPLALDGTGLWLASGLGLFALGWVIQFLGHYYEGRKPAFVDDLMGLVVGPLFVVAELGFLLGLRPEVQEAVEQRAGPTCIRQPKAIA